MVAGWFLVRYHVASPQYSGLKLEIMWESSLVSHSIWLHFKQALKVFLVVVLESGGIFNLLCFARDAVPSLDGSVQ